ncbi:hypothetical protein GCM10011514_38670 [Emticicia aquatilis]|uniref:Ig-like domain-containing protein n=1 Tax=Emticicia aquatilis TaxID=1537369 RepID=A0A917DVH5_9BACT|nr:3-coathanger stack domain-containing protein [Emticicia aquatilis]GGD70817.1 hypothetical protein GCM10011514_38670 [Emticicia aquatilis]
MKKNTTFSFNNRWLYTYCFYLISLIASAQNLQLLRQASSGGYNSIIASVTDDTGNLYVLGGYNGVLTWGTISLPTAASNESYIAKFDVSGNCLWVKRFGGVSYDIALSGSSIYITGYFSGTINFNTPSAAGSNELTNAAGGGDIFVAKFDTDGNIQWARRAGGTNSYVDMGEGIAATSDAVYVVGYFYGTANFNTPYSAGSNEITSAGGTDGFIAKFDTNGEIQTIQRIGGTGLDYCREIAIKSNEIYVVGDFSETANFNTPSAFGTNELVSAGLTDGFLARYDNTGAIQWLRRFGGVKSDNTPDIALSTNDVYVLGGWGGTSNFNTPSAFGSNEITSASTTYDACIAKFNDAGTFQWAKRAGSTSAATGGSSIFASNNAVFFTGKFSRTINFNTPAATGSNELISAGTVSEDMFVAKYDEAGVFKWAKRGGGAGDDAGYSVTVRNNSLYVLGSFTRTANFNTPSASGSNELTTSTITSYFAKYTTIALPTFSTQPTNESICENGDATLTVVATDASTFQWQIYNGSTYVDLTNINPYNNITTSSLTITSPLNSLDGSMYRCVATSEAGSTNSNPATLTIIANNVAETTNITGQTVLKKAAQNLTATNSITANANVNYSAGKSVLMNAGFQVQSGSVYSAVIQNTCN